MPNDQCRRYAHKTRYAMQNFNDCVEIRVHVCGREPVLYSLLCAFDNFVRFMASRMSSGRSFVRIS